MIGGIPLKELVENEIFERQQEGCEVPDYTERLKNADNDELLKIYDELDAIEISENFPFNEPDNLEEILKESDGCDYKKIPESEGFFSKFYGAWLGRIVGCIMGKPFEKYPFGAGDGTLDGWQCIKLWQEGNGEKFPPEDYISVNSTAKEQFGWESGCPDSQKENITFAESDDDIRYLVLGLLINEKFGNNFTPNDVANMWHTYLTKNMVFTAEYIAMLNSYVCEIKDKKEQIEFCRKHHNPFREWIGAQIRVDHYGYYNAGDPLTAAKSAFNDAYFSHAKNGIYGAMFFAALIATAFTEKDIEKCIETALKVVPKKSRFYDDISFTIESAKQCKTAEELYEILWEKFRGFSCVHTNNNACVCVGALIMSKDDFVKAVSIAVGAGWDTDCNGATVGSVMGALLGTEAIPDYLSAPLNDTLYSSVINFHPASIRECAERSYKLFMEKE